MESAEQIQPLLHPTIENLLKQESDLLFTLRHGFGGTIHILFPEIFTENVQCFREVGEKLGIDLAIYYATKANKSFTFLEAASGQHISADVSSIHELRSALNHGIAGFDISLSGPDKEKNFLLLAIQQGCRIVLDTVDELDNIKDLIRIAQPKDRVRVLLRRSDYQVSESRFGVASSELNYAYEQLSQSADKIDFEGFAFHINDYSLESRKLALEKALIDVLEARKKGFQVKKINIGGGFPIRYLSQKDTEIAKQATSYQNKKFPNHYPYDADLTKHQFLESLLCMPCSLFDGKLFKEVMREMGITLMIEPGRALLDQAGITVFPVRGTRKSSRGNPLVIVDGNMNHLSEQWFNTDFLPGPTLISRNSVQAAGYQAAVVGNTCMESDILSWRNITFTSTPQSGDLLVYANTAGYQMDSNESTFHQIPLPPKIALFKGKNPDHYSWKRDEDFSLLNL